MLKLEIGIHEETRNLLDTYCKLRPSTPENIFDRVLRGWYSTAARMWAKNPNLIPKLEKVDENKITKLNIDHTHAKAYLKTLDQLNKKLNINLCPVALATWLTNIFIKTYNLKEMSKYKESFGKMKKF